MAATKEREAVQKLARSDNFKNKVDKMSDTQIIAIYLRLKAERKL